MKPARILLIDDPTPYGNRRASRKDGSTTRFGIGVAHRYSRGCMTETDLMELGVLLREVCAPDVYNFSWATMPNLDMAMRIMKARGFAYKTTPFVWEKLYRNGNTFCGAGSYGFSNHELVLLGRRPRTKLWHPHTLTTKPRTAVRTLHPMYQVDPHGRKDRHSIKTEEVQDRIDRWLDPFLDGHVKVELFATRKRPGWICLGYDVTGNDIRDDLRALAEEMKKAPEGLAVSVSDGIYLAEDDLEVGEGPSCLEVECRGGRVR